MPAHTPGAVSLKKFEILEMIAKGGMAEVYRARTTGLEGFEKEVCVKKILPHLTEDEAFVTMFINEAKLAATLSFANIVHVHDLCVSAGGDYFIVMEYVDGKDLSDIIRAAQLAGREVPPEIAVHIAREVCQGLDYAHRRTDRDGAPLGIIHRDISPHNVLVSFMGEVKIVDFGIAKASHIATKTAVGILKGKYGYMSPEQAQGKPLDPRSDIFNTGIVLYEMLVGERCFAGASDFSTLSLMRNAEVTPPAEVNPKVPRSLEAIVLKALAKKREDRPQTALELEGELASWAKASNALTVKSDLARFMRELFEAAPANQRGPSTGMLEVESVVGPPPEAPAPRPSTQREPALADRPVESPPEEAKPPEPARAEAPAKAEAPPKPDPAPAKAEARAAPKADASPGPVKAEPSPAPKADPAPAKAEVPKAKTPEPKAPPKAEPAKAEPAAKAPEKKAVAKKAPAKKKKASGPRVPVGKAQLQPKSAGRNPRRRVRWTAFAAALVLLVAGISGVAVGTWRTGAVSKESAFRQMELASRRATDETFGLVVIESNPPGLAVRLDGMALAEPAPLALERPVDAATHRVELLDGEEVVATGELERSGRIARYAGGPGGTREPEPVRLELVADPRALVKVDGEVRGRVRDGPFSLTPGESHRVQLKLGKRRRTVRVEPVPGQAVTLALSLD